MFGPGVKMAEEFVYSNDGETIREGRLRTWT